MVIFQLTEVVYSPVFFLDSVHVQTNSRVVYSEDLIQPRADPISWCTLQDWAKSLPAFFTFCIMRCNRVLYTFRVHFFLKYYCDKYAKHINFPRNQLVQNIVSFSCIYFSCLRHIGPSAEWMFWFAVTHCGSLWFVSSSIVITFILWWYRIFKFFIPLW